MPTGRCGFITVSTFGESVLFFFKQKFLDCRNSKSGNFRNYCYNNKTTFIIIIKSQGVDAVHQCMALEGLIDNFITDSPVHFQKGNLLCLILNQKRMYRFDVQCLFYNNHNASATIPDGKHPPQSDTSCGTGSGISNKFFFGPPHLRNSWYPHDPPSLPITSTTRFSVVKSREKPARKRRGVGGVAWVQMKSGLPCRTCFRIHNNRILPDF